MKEKHKSIQIPISLNSKITNKRRDEIIEKQQFPNNKTISNFSAKNIKTYTDRYKQEDIKKALAKIYDYKCAYCESKVEQNDIEHYRPKSIYYWLAYSWDNLLYCCPTCNQKKSNIFPVKKLTAEFDKKDINQIHQLSDKYAKSEEPILINPEKDNVFSDIIFNKNGKFETENNKNDRITATIEQLDLNREYLAISRKEIYEKLEKSITEKQFEVKSGNNEARIKLEQIIETFINNINSEYYTYRKYIIQNWIEELINNN